MSRLTSSLPDEMEKILRDRLSDIVKLIIEKLPDTLSIILGGSFAKGEGSVIVNGNEIKPLKDLDIYVFLNHSPNKKIAAEIEESVSKVFTNESSVSDSRFEFNKFRVDIEYLRPRNLDWHIDLFSYDMRMHGVVLYGKNLLRAVSWNLEQIGPNSPMRYIFEKMTGLIALSSQEMFDGHNVSDSRRLLINYECAKTYVEIGSVLTFMFGVYDPKASIRIKNLQSLSHKRLNDLTKDIPFLLQKIEDSTQKKLFPSSGSFLTAPLANWMSTKNDLLLFAKWFIECEYKTQVCNWHDDIIDIIKVIGQNYYDSMARGILQSSLKNDSEVLIRILSTTLAISANVRFIIQSCLEGMGPPPYSIQRIPSIVPIYLTAPMMLDSIDDGILNPMTLTVTARYLKKINPSIDVLTASWDVLRDEYLKSYYAYHSPR